MKTISQSAAGQYVSGTSTAECRPGSLSTISLSSSWATADSPSLSDLSSLGSQPRGGSTSTAVPGSSSVAHGASPAPMNGGVSRTTQRASLYRSRATRFEGRPPKTSSRTSSTSATPVRTSDACVAGTFSGVRVGVGLGVGLGTATAVAVRLGAAVGTDVVEAGAVAVAGRLAGDWGGSPPPLDVQAAASAAAARPRARSFMITVSAFAPQTELVHPLLVGHASGRYHRPKPLEDAPGRGSARWTAAFARPCSRSPARPPTARTCTRASTPSSRTCARPRPTSGPTPTRY